MTWSRLVRNFSIFSTIFSQLVHVLFVSTCSWLVRNLFTNCLRLVQNLLHYLFTIWTCSQLVYGFYMTCSWIFKNCSRPVHDIGLVHMITTSSWLVCNFLKLVHNLFMTCSWLFHNFFHKFFTLFSYILNDSFSNFSNFFTTCSWLVHLSSTSWWLVLN